MGTSNNAKIQKLMDEAGELADDDGNLEEKLLQIAQLVQAEQQKVKSAVKSTSSLPTIADDPADAFACEGCQ